MNKVVKKIVITSLIIYLVIAIVFAAIAFLDYSFLIGWLAGGLVSLVSYFLGIFLIGFIFKKPKTITKKIGFFLGWTRTWVQMILHAICLISVIIINNVANGNSVFGGGMSDMLSPINLITYIVGIGLMMIGTLIAHTFKKGGKYETIRR